MGESANYWVHMEQEGQLFCFYCTRKTQYGLLIWVFFLKEDKFWNFENENKQQQKETFNIQDTMLYQYYLNSYQYM